MIRRVAFGKAVFAGSMGALAWELAARAVLLFGVPVFDLVYTLGTMIAGDVHAWIWWPLGIVLHLTVGAIWAIFYAYFFWSTFDWRPVAQGRLCLKNLSFSPGFQPGARRVRRARNRFNGFGVFA